MGFKGYGVLRFRVMGFRVLRLWGEVDVG